MAYVSFLSWIPPMPGGVACGWSWYCRSSIPWSGDVQCRRCKASILLSLQAASHRVAAWAGLHTFRPRPLLRVPGLVTVGDLSGAPSIWNLLGLLHLTDLSTRTLPLAKRRLQRRMVPCRSCCAQAALTGASAYHATIRALQTCGSLPMDVGSS